MLQIYNTVGTFVEKEVHDGQIGHEAVFRGKDLEIRLFQIQVGENGVCALGMDDLPKVFHLRFTLIVLRQTKIDLDAGLLYKEAYQSEVEVEKTLMSTFKDSEKFILVIIEICRHAICRDYGSLMLLDPWRLVVNLYFSDWYLMGATLMNDRERKGLDTFRSVESAAVAV
jgi:hypothetical protein